MKNFLLYLGPDAPDKVSWATRAETAGLSTGSGSLADARQLINKKVAVLVPGADVLLTEVTLPRARRRMLRASIPYLLEENLAEDIDLLHFGVGTPAKNGLTPVAVVSKDKMTAWLDMLAEAGIEAETVSPATLAVPLYPGQWSLLVTDHQFLLRKDTWLGYGGDLENMALYLADEPAPDQEQTVKQIQLFNCTDEQIDFAELSPNLTARTRNCKSAIDTMATGYAKPLNLLQGQFGHHTGWRDFWYQWRLPIVAAVLIVLLNFAMLTTDFFQLRSELGHLNNRIKSVYLETFPKSRRVVDARAQMAQHLVELQKSTGQQGGFFLIYDQAAPLLADTPGFSLNNLRYKDDRFNFEIEVDNLQALDSLKTNLAKMTGATSEIKNAEASGNLVKARLQVNAEIDP